MTKDCENKYKICRENAVVDGKKLTQADAAERLFISIHHNGNTGNWGNWSYVCAFYNVNKPKRDADLAAMLATEISKQTGIKNSGGLPDTKSAVGSLHMVRETKSTIPSVLCEGGFMDSTIDYPIITSEKGQRSRN